MKLKKKYHHIYNFNKRKLISLFQHSNINNKKYKRCIKCNYLIYKDPQPLIKTNDNEYTLLYCNYCWNNSSINKKLYNYLKIKNINISTTIDNIIKYSNNENITKTKYLRKLKLNKINKT